MNPTLPLLAIVLAQPVAQAPVPAATADLPAAATVAGVSADLAAERVERIADLRYALELSIPPAKDTAIAGHVTITFTLRDAARPLVLDFAPGADRILRSEVNGQAVPLVAGKAHLVAPVSLLREGDNRIDLGFTAGDASLNRGDEFMYSLFVPSRAHLAFPCFDQPSLKAVFALTLEHADTWVALSNGAET